MQEKYKRVLQELKSFGKSKMKCIGNSMTPRVISGSVLTFETRTEYDVGDIVFCKARGNMYVHLILKKDTRKGYLIGNNKGRENGWTHTIYGKAVKIEEVK